jgi:FkbM family methyltransferase
MLKKLAHNISNLSVLRPLHSFLKATGDWRTNLHLVRLRRKVWDQKSGATVRCLDYAVRITDGPNFYMQYKDEFIHRIYHFEAERSDPLIIDGGSNTGISILYFKRAYPQARVIGLEPDPNVFRLLQENMTRNKIENVTLINKGLSAESGTATFIADGSSGGQLGEGGDGMTVRVERLSTYLTEPVDFLKLNIEGEELPVLLEAEASGKLRNIREMVLEYHGWPGGEQRLGPILDLLDRQGYRYLVHDFDAQTCRASKPPFKLTPDTTWFCLVYAQRVDDVQAQP